MENNGGNWIYFQIGRLQRELSDTKEEVRGVLSALEEVAGSIEQKNKELEDKQTEFEREATLNREKQVSNPFCNHQN